MQIVAPRMKGFIALDSHPVGCSSQVKRLVESVGGEAPAEIPGAGPVVVIGSSGGYGLPAAAVAAFRYRRPVVGVCLERPAQRGRTATAGWYNSVALSEEASRRDANIVTVNADCFSDDTKQRVIDLLRTHDHPPSALVYSVAAPVRTDPTTGTTFRSVLKPIGEPFATKTVKLDSGEITNVTLEPATEEEIGATIQVMGGDDWRRWIDALRAASLLEPPFRTVAFDYVGPSITHPIYRSGTIGCAKAHLARTANGLDEVLAPGGGGVGVGQRRGDHAELGGDPSGPAVPQPLASRCSRRCCVRDTGRPDGPTVRRLPDRQRAGSRRRAPLPAGRVGT